ncbi:MAG: hypothetical protein V3R59_04865 [Gammaproteobacteria bacterium]
MDHTIIPRAWRRIDEIRVSSAAHAPKTAEFMVPGKLERLTLFWTITPTSVAGGK